MAQEHQNPQNGGPETELKTDITFPNIGEEDTTAEPEVDPVQAQLRAMEERFEQNQQAFAEERARWQQTVDRLIQAQPQAQPQTPQQPQAQPIDFGDLPDPVDKPDAFKKALAQRFEQEMQQRLSSSLDSFQQKQTSQQTVQQQLDEVWNRFQQDYSDLASKTITLKGAVLAEREAMQQRNIDPQQGILSDPDGFMSRVATRMRNELGIAAPQQQQQQQQQQAQQPAQPVNRTAGVGGGSRMNGSGGGDKKFPSFVDQLKKEQLDKGLI